MPESPNERLIPLSEAAKYAGVTPEHLNLLARKGRLSAQKIGRNWFTTKQWLDEYFKADQIQEDNGSDFLALRELEKEERIALARIRAEVELRQIERDEKLALSQNQNIVAQATEEGGDSVMPSLELLNLMAQEIKKLRSEMQDEQGQKQALLFAFEHLQNQVGEDIDRRVADMYYQLNDKFVNLILQNEAISQDPSDQLELFDTQKREDLLDFFVRQLNLVKKQIKDETEKLSRQVAGGVQASVSPETELMAEAKEPEALRADIAPVDFAELVLPTEETRRAEQMRAGIKEWMDRGLQMLMDETFRASLLEVGEGAGLVLRHPLSTRREFATVFVRNQPAAGSRRAPDLFERTVGWTTRPLHEDRVHYLSTASGRLIRPDELFMASGNQIGAGWTGRPYVSFAAGVAVLMLAFISTHNPAPWLRSGLDEIGTVGQEELLPAKLGFDAAERVVLGSSKIVSWARQASQVLPVVPVDKTELAETGRFQQVSREISEIQLSRKQAISRISSGISEIGARELVFARVGQSLPEQVYVAVRQTPQDIASAMGEFSPRGTWYDPTVYDWSGARSTLARLESSATSRAVRSLKPVYLARNTLQQQLSRQFVSPSIEPVNPAEQTAQAVAGRVLSAIQTAKNSYINTGKEFLSAFDRFGGDEGQVAGSRVESNDEQIVQSSQEEDTLWSPFRRIGGGISQKINELTEKFRKSQ